MKSSKFWVVIILVTVFILSILSYGIPNNYYFGFNLTPSMEKGFYYKSQDQTLTHGDIIAFCLDEELSQTVHAERYIGKGFCPNGTKKLLKYAAGLQGDLVEITDKGIYVTPQGKSISCFWGVPKEQDKDGNSMVVLLKDGIIPENRILAMTPHKGSFDSRYFGLIDVETVTKMEKL